MASARTGKFKSRAQQRFAFGTDQPWAKKWGDNTDFHDLPQHVKEDDAKEAVSQSAMGALNRNPIVVRAPRKIKVVPKDRFTEDEMIEFVSAKKRRQTQTLPGGRYPMPDKKHAELALQMINNGNLSPAEKTKVRGRADRMLGK
jgi:hypothetical protein